MEHTSSGINWPVIIIVGVVVLLLLVFVLRRNRKDKEDMTQTMNNVDTKPPEHDSENESKV